jgi:hypothetical protein
MKKVTISKWLSVCMLACLWTSATYAQDSVKVKMICFEYDDSGSVVLEQLVSEKEEQEDIDEFEALLNQEEQKEQQQTEQNTRLGLGQEEHLFINSSDGRTIKVVLYNYEDYTERTLRVHSLSGVSMFSASIEDALSTFNLNQLPSGIYIVSLTLDGKRETKKFSIQ